MNLQRKLGTSLLSNLVNHLDLTNDEKYGYFYKDLVKKSKNEYMNNDITYYNCTLTYSKFKELLSDLYNIEEGDKLAFSTENPNEPFAPLFEYIISIDKPRTLWSINRWLYGNSRTRTIDMLRYFIVEYAKHLDKILIGMEKEHMYSLFYNFSLKVSSMNDSILKSFYNLTRTYLDYKPIGDIHDTFKILITDFNTRTSIINQALSRTSSETLKYRNKQRQVYKKEIISHSLPIESPSFTTKVDDETPSSMTYRPDISSKMSVMLNGDTVSMNKSNEKPKSPNEEMPYEISDEENNELPEEIQLSAVNEKQVSRKKQVSNLRREIAKRQNKRRKKRRGKHS
jgi:hypothetical protein